MKTSALMLLALSTMMPAHARAQSGDPFASVRFDCAACAEATAPPVPRLLLEETSLPSTVDVQTSPAPTVAFQYSHAYEVRNRIHKDASYAMLPLFGAEAWLGEKLFNNPPQGKSGTKSAHQMVAVAIGGLLGLNTVTGVWNLVDGRKDPHRGVRPVVHGILMLIADGGFFATALTTPKSRTAAQLATYDSRKKLHLELASVSISTAMVGYLMMLFK